MTCTHTWSYSSDSLVPLVHVSLTLISSSSSSPRHVRQQPPPPKVAKTPMRAAEMVSVERTRKDSMENSPREQRNRDQNRRRSSRDVGGEDARDRNGAVTHDTYTYVHIDRAARGSTSGMGDEGDDGAGWIVPCDRADAPHLWDEWKRYAYEPHTAAASPPESFQGVTQGVGRSVGRGVGRQRRSSLPGLSSQQTQRQQHRDPVERRLWALWVKQNVTPPKKNSKKNGCEGKACTN